MAASLALHGAVNEELFLDTQGEMFFIMAKLYPLLDGMREKMQSPQMMQNCETLIDKSEANKQKLQDFIKRVERFRAMAASQKK
jgi:ferritin-like metal-binding protein YciE